MSGDCLPEEMDFQQLYQAHQSLENITLFHRMFLCIIFTSCTRRIVYLLDSWISTVNKTSWCCQQTRHCKEKKQENHKLLWFLFFNVWFICVILSICRNEMSGLDSRYTPLVVFALRYHSTSFCSFYSIIAITGKDYDTGLNTEWAHTPSMTLSWVHYKSSHRASERNTLGRGCFKNISAEVLLLRAWSKKKNPV